MAEWRDWSLSDVLRPTDERVGVQDLGLVLSVTEKRGIIPQTEVFKKRIATTDVTKYKVLRPLDIAYNPYLLWTGAVGQWLGDRPGITSPVYQTFRVIPPHEPRFVGLLLDSGVLRSYFDSTAVGSIQRRRRTTVPVFLAAQASLPDRDTQRRIVDLIGALDTQIASERAASESATDVLLGLLGQHAGSVSGQDRRIVDCCSAVVGGIWGQPPSESEMDVAALGPRIYAPGTPGFIVDGSPLRSYTTRQVASRLVRRGDIILERSGGSPSQPVGRVVIAGGDEGSCVPTDFQRLLRPNPEIVLPRYLFWRLWQDWRTGVTRGYSRRTTGITNLSVPVYLARSVLLPTREEQAGIASLADAASDAATAMMATALELVELRGCLLLALLGRDQEIPASYDRLFKDAI